MNIIAPIFHARFIKDTYACIPERGLHAGLVRANSYTQKNDYCLKMDVKKFYPSIHHETLYKIIERKIKDENVLWLINNIIHSFEGDRNCPIGNLTSQWFGNIYLTQLDYFIKQKLRAKYYIRYCDDFLIFSNDKMWLNQCKEEITQILDNVLKLKMKIDEKQICIDGKTICSTATMKEHERPMHIITALLADESVSLGQITVESKSNEIPAVRELIELLEDI